MSEVACFPSNRPHGHSHLYALSYVRLEAIASRLEAIPVTVTSPKFSRRVARVEVTPARV